MGIALRLNQLKATLPQDVTLVAVSKFQPVEALQQAYDAGQRVFGESRVQELVAKQPLLPAAIEWHFIGPLQSNKVKYIAPFVHTIQSIDSLKLLHEVDRQAARHNRIIRVLLEVHVAQETSKHGFGIDECRELAAKGSFGTFPHVEIAGLMAMATYTENTQQVQHEFTLLQHLFNECKTHSFAGLSFRILSMGMSNDYQIALACGSNTIRIGTAIFSPAAEPQ